MKQSLIIVFFCLLLAACQNQELTEEDAPMGILTGQVVWFEGNLMPGMGLSMPSGKPVERTVVIYAPTTYQDVKGEGVLFNTINTQQIIDVKSDEAGFFTVELPPGKYSVFTQEDKGLFANNADGDGHINPVTIQSGETVNMLIKVDYEAYH